MENKTYAERLKELLSKPVKGEKRIYDIKNEEVINVIKEQLKNNFSVTLWAYDCPDEQIKEDQERLKKANIINYYDDKIKGFLCFTNEQAMNEFKQELFKQLNEKY